VNHHSPPQGVILRENYGTILVWFDSQDRLHVVDVTNMDIVQQIEKAPYVSPDESFFQNLENDVAGKLKDLPSKLPSITTVLVIVAVVAGLVIVADRKL
jgi:hypothetical protein